MLCAWGCDYKSHYELSSGYNNIRAHEKRCKLGKITKKPENKYEVVYEFGKNKI